MAKAPGTFTVWYLPMQHLPASDDHYERDITASSPEDLMRQAQTRRPDGKYIKAIRWQHDRTHTMWYRVPGRTLEQCWDAPMCARAFGG